MRTRRVTRKALVSDARPTPTDRARYACARDVGRRESADYSAVADAWCDTQFHQVGLEFRTGARVLIPQRLIAGLERASIRDLVTVTVSPAGDALSWRSLDVDVAVPGVIERAVGRRLFASTTAPALEPAPEVQPAAVPPTFGHSVGSGGGPLHRDERGVVKEVAHTSVQRAD